jgi:hypothetical protein
MVNLFIFVLVAYGISNILIYGSIFEWWRRLISKLGTGDTSLYKLFTCMMCLPTWVGFGLSYVLQSHGIDTPMTIYGVDNYYVAIFFDGMLASGGVYAFNVLVEHFEGE